MMTLEEAIKHCKDVALSCTNKECALEHFQLLKWLQEYSNMLEKQEEQKPVEEYNITGIGSKNAQGKLGEMIKNLNPADNIEPKFKVGDIITNGKIIGKVDENENNKYHGWFGYDKDLSVYYADIPDIENWHLWTIQDAKDGDVLDCGNDIVIFKENNYNPKDQSGCMFVYCSYNNFYEIGGINPTFYTPATKEQSELLFQKMKEAGYEWDTDKKELKKGEQNPAWSEEDEKILNEIFSVAARASLRKSTLFGKSYDYIKWQNWLKSLKDRVQPKQGWSKEDEENLNQVSVIVLGHAPTYGYSKKYNSWLKSLKKRYTWKPSDKQMEQLGWIAEQNKDNLIGKELMTLYSDLKKLRKE